MMAPLGEKNKVVSYVGSSNVGVIRNEVTSCECTADAWMVAILNLDERLQQIIKTNILLSLLNLSQHHSDQLVQKT